MLGAAGLGTANLTLQVERVVVVGSEFARGWLAPGLIRSRGLLHPHPASLHECLIQ
jgi:hypothetical protein